MYPRRMADLQKLQDAARTYIAAVFSEFPQAQTMGLSILAIHDNAEYGLVLSTAEQMRPIGPGNHVEATALVPDEAAQDRGTGDPASTDSQVSTPDSDADTPVSDSTDE